MGEEIKDACFNLRKEILDLATRTNDLMNHSDLIGKANDEKHGEMRANIKLAYRHLEDSRMRIGKVVQACDGGTSCYPK